MRRLPIVCLVVAVFFWMAGRIRFPKTFRGKTVRMDDGKRFVVFRHAHRKSKRRESKGAPAVMVVRFRFARFSQKANRRLSRIPIPLIVGYPGFHDKVWMANGEDGTWQGVYQWESAAAVEVYKRSFVLGVMNRRAVADSVTVSTILDTTVHDYLRQRLEEP
jgi:hypothetical protein